MIILVIPHILGNKIRAIAILPFIILKKKEFKENKIILNHEKIHLKQQIELIWFLFFIFYFIEFIIRYIKYKDSFIAYLNISFEKEAYKNENDLGYLEHRKIFSFLKYL